MKYCSDLKNVLSTGVHHTGNAQRLAEVQEEILDLGNTIDMSKECIRKAEKSGFGYKIESQQLYRAMVQTMLKINLIHKILTSTLDPFQDDVIDLELMLVNIYQKEIWILNRMKQNAPDSWEDTLEYMFNLDTEDDL